jgi:hypothetical protein
MTLAFAVILLVSRLRAAHAGAGGGVGFGAASMLGLFLVLAIVGLMAQAFTGPFLIFGVGLLVVAVYQRNAFLAVWAIVIGGIGVFEGFFGITNRLPLSLWAAWEHSAIYLILAFMTVLAGIVAWLRENRATLHADGLMNNEFVDWLDGASGELDINLGYLLENDHPELNWLRGIFHTLGPVSSARLRQLAEEATERSVQAALGVMNGEAAFYHRTMPDARIEERESVAVPGRRGFYFLGYELKAWTIEFAILDIGDIVQGKIMERDLEAWPVCKLHGFGLHLRIFQEKVVWWCIPGDHPDRIIYVPA